MKRTWFIRRDNAEVCMTKCELRLGVELRKRGVEPFGVPYSLKKARWGWWVIVNQDPDNPERCSRV